MGQNPVAGAVDSVECLNKDSLWIEDEEEEEEEEFCTQLEQCPTSCGYLSKKELILEASNLVELVSPSSGNIVGERQVEKPVISHIDGEKLSEEAETDCDELIEIELRSEHQTDEEDSTSDIRRTSRIRSCKQEEEESPMYVEDNCRRLPAQVRPDEQVLGQQHHHQFSNAPTKIEFASRRVKDYFESFRGGHRGEKRRLYQFFKSTRTELVACLIFSLCTSQTLIVIRSAYLQVTPTSSNNLYHDLIAQQETTNGVSVHLTQAVAVALTVASLTQVFGHISGCHLIPSISLALYVKGHISKGRLASYLMAQTTGAALGVSLLSLLRSSQISLDEYWHILRSAQLKYSSPEEQAISGLQAGHGHRRKRDTAPSSGTGAGTEVDSSSEPEGGGSETILLSIMEQQLQSKHARRSYPSAAAPSPSGSFLKSPERNISNNSTSPPETSSDSVELPTSTAKTTFMEQLATVLRARTPVSSPASVVSTSTASSTNSSTGAPVDLTNRPFETSEPPNDGSRVPAPSSAPSSPSSPTILESSLPPPDETRDSSQQLATARRRNKRNRQTQTTTSSSSSSSSSLPSSSSIPKPAESLLSHKLVEPPGVVQPSSPLIDQQQSGYLASTGHNQPAPAAGYYINLLELSLPSAIMSSDSIRNCINRQFQMNHQKAPTVMMNESGLATLGFRHCLSLSNSSQMFIFQFLATLLLVLVYLVNVDPRRIDLGFKSLSIGIAYSVAGLLTIQSGGFYGNPFQLLFLSWLSPGTEWQTEWFVYLVTPLVGGLFGAVSHEYIDFTSLRNRNKQLHLRRSFYSLDNLPEAEQAQLQQLPILLDHTPSVVHHKSRCEQFRHHQQQQQQVQSSIQHPQEEAYGQQLDASDLPKTSVVEVRPMGCGAELVAAARRSRMASSSSSLESSLGARSSSVASLARATTVASVQDQVLTAGAHEQQELFVVGPGNNRKLASSSSAGLNNCSRSNSYSRRLKLDQHQLQLADRQRKMSQCSAAQGAPHGELGKQTQRTSLRRSDFDSNFLISSTTAGPNSSPTAIPRQHRVVNSSAGWM